VIINKNGTITDLDLVVKIDTITINKLIKTNDLLNFRKVGIEYE
jgi:hypothetical protein